MKLSKSQTNKLNGYGICSQTDVNNATPLFALGCDEFSYGVVLGGEKVNGKWVLDVVHADSNAHAVRRLYTMCELTDGSTYSCFLYGGSMTKEMDGMRISKITHAVKRFVRTKTSTIHDFWLFLASSDETLACLRTAVKGLISKLDIEMTEEEREKVKKEVVQSYYIRARYL